MPRPFLSAPDSTVNIDVSSSSDSVKITDTRSSDVRVMNNGTATVWIKFGASGLTASVSTGIPIGPGTTETHGIPATDGSAIYVAAIAAGSTGKIYFTPGNGL